MTPFVFGGGLTIHWQHLEIAEAAANCTTDKVVSPPFFQNSVRTPSITYPLLLKVCYFKNLTIAHVGMKTRNYIYSNYASISVVALPIFYY